MAAVARYLADTSALARLHLAEVTSVLAPRIEAGLVATLRGDRVRGPVVDVLAERVRKRPRRPAAGYEWLTTEDIDWRRALDVQGILWATSRMRSVPLPDLLIAAVAERNRVTIVHYDADYDTIASITGQPTQWVVERGSVL